MFPVRLPELSKILGGELLPNDSTGGVVSGATIDSRSVCSGDAFFAIQGDRHHGSEFGADAVAHGAAVVVSDRPLRGIRSPSGEERSSSVPLILVPDVVAALHELARWNRLQSDALRVCVTGSVGKTTTRQMIHAVLSAACSGIQSPANFNNHLGLPLSLLKLSPNDSFAALEIGASGPGEIAALAGLAMPEFSVVTRVAPAHLTGFGSLDGVRRAKQELVEQTVTHGTVFLNGDDPLVRAMASAAVAEVVYFGEAADCQVRATDVRISDGRLSFRVSGVAECDDLRFVVSAAGRHNITCALAAVAVGLQAGMDPRMIQSGLANFHAGKGRGQILQLPRWTVIDDSYNASPASLTAAISTLAKWSSGRRRILVLGDMLELGDDAVAMHEAAGAEIAREAVDLVLFYGDFAEAAARGFLNVSGLKGLSRVSAFDDLNVLLTMLDCLAETGDVILVKGSRGMATERVVSWLVDNGADPNVEQQRNAA